VNVRAIGFTALISFSAGAAFVRFATRAASPTALDTRATVRELMDSLVDPSADAVWDSVGTIVDAKGVHAFAPKTPAEWTEVRRGSVRLAEGANLLLVPGRAVAQTNARSDAPGVELEPADIERRIAAQRDVFVGLAAALRDGASDARDAADARDPALLLRAGDRIERACEACHRAFWYPREAVPKLTGWGAPFWVAAARGVAR